VYVPWFRDLYRLQLITLNARQTSISYLSSSTAARWTTTPGVVFGLWYALDCGRGFLVANSLLIERMHDPRATVPAPREEDYRDEHGLLCQRSHCRRYRRTRVAVRRDWIPPWVRRQPVRTSHGLCRICCDYFYPKHTPGMR
jgi:hypothetical protein